VKAAIVDEPKGWGLRGPDGIDEKIQDYEDQMWKKSASIETNCGGAIKRGDSRNASKATLMDAYSRSRETKQKYDGLGLLMATRRYNHLFVKNHSSLFAFRISIHILRRHQ